MPSHWNAAIYFGDLVHFPAKPAHLTPEQRSNWLARERMCANFFISESFYNFRKKNITSPVKQMQADLSVTEILWFNCPKVVFPKLMLQLQTIWQLDQEENLFLLQLVQIGYNFIRNYLFSSHKDFYVIVFVNIFPYLNIKLFLPWYLLALLPLVYNPHRITCTCL